MTTAFRVCPLCEATCGLELEIDGEAGRIRRVRGDRDNVFSRGFICPKGASFDKVVHDPDRLRRPLVKRDGAHVQVSWDEAFAAVADGLGGVFERHGPEALAVYVGNPNAHTMAGGFYLGALLRTLRTKSRFSASTVDQMPKQVACGFMYGHPFSIPVPDLDRTDLCVLLGANPWESNGSLCTAPDFPGRLEAIQARGGRFVVIDPRRTRTAARADQHIPIRPGTDAFLLAAVVHVLFDEGLVDLGPHLEAHVNGTGDLHALAKDFPPEAVEAVCGVSAPVIRSLARDIAGARRAAVYGRIGTCTAGFGTVASWLVDAVNVLTGNLDRPGGAMWPLAPHLRPRRSGKAGKGFSTGRWRSRVRGAPEVIGELPAATMAEEIDTPGPGRLRALLTVAGNPVLSIPNSGGRLDAALAGLEFMVSVDPYLNETSRHADVILPPADPARVGHYDHAFTTLSIRNVAIYSPPVLAPEPDGMDEAEILARLIAIAAGRGPGADPATVDAELFEAAIDRAVNDPDSAWFGRPADELRAAVTGDSPLERLLDVHLRTSPYGLTLDQLKAAPHGIDLGPLQPRLPEVLRTPSGRVELCPPELAGDLARLRAALDTRGAPEALVLIGRRDLRSNNSWMHNVTTLVKGKERCTLQVHPDDASRLGLAAGAPAVVRSRVGEVVAPVEVTADVMAGVVSLPHGWGHDRPGTRLSVASGRPGVNVNLLVDEAEIDPLSGNAVLNGIPVTVAPA